MLCAENGHTVPRPLLHYVLALPRPFPIRDWSAVRPTSFYLAIMTFREKVKRVFHRSSSSTSQLNGKPKIEYYRRHEVPPSKFRGPFDKEHQKRLAAWSFDRAMVERPRSLDLPISPGATYDICPFDSDDTGDISPDDDGVAIDPGMY